MILKLIFDRNDIFGIEDMSRHFTVEKLTSQRPLVVKYHEDTLLS